MNKRILIISSHPDDESICSGGLIMKAKKEGDKVYVLFMATGDSRQFMNGETKQSTRIDEIKKAAKFGNFEYSIGFYEKSTIVDTLPQKALIETIEDYTKIVKPDLVVIPNRKSFNQDHRAVAEACLTAFRPIPKSLHPQPKIILEMEEPYLWEGFRPNFYVEISDIEERMQLYKCHTTQVPNPPHPRSIENLTRLAGMRGNEISTQYAEGYNLIKEQI